MANAEPVGITSSILGASVGLSLSRSSDCNASHVGHGKTESGPSMDEFMKALADRFEGWELAELLDIPAEDIILAFKDLIEDKTEDLRDYIDYT